MTVALNRADKGVWVRPLRRLARRLLVVIGAIAAGVIGLVTGLPVMLLFLVTAVPLWVSVPLAAIDVALLAAFLRLEGTPLASVALLAGLAATSLVATWMSQAFARTPSIKDASGRPAAGSIASLERVELNGSQQWITVRGRDASAPILLYLAGGPGGSELAFARNVLGGLEDHFVVVNWDQPGAGKSYAARPIDRLTLDQYIADAHALVLQLCERFHQDQIFVFGESWGTVLGVRLVQAHPELFRGYVGAGQRTSVREDDVLGYKAAIRLADEQGKTGLVAKFRRNGPPPYAGNGMLLRYMDYLNVLNGYASEHGTVDTDGHNLFIDGLTGIEYGLVDKVNTLRGIIDTFTSFYPQLVAVDIPAQTPRLEVPVYFLQGRYDLVEMDSLLETWVETLDAPHKEIVYFEQSGHTPHSYEPSRVAEVIVNRLLPATEGR
jgi:pimeloyl-ACP methyl ester carboxylesterase